MSILDEDFDVELNMLRFTIKSEHPIRVSDFAKSIAALNHLYSQIVKRNKNVIRVRSDQPYELSIYSVDKCCIVFTLIESNPVDGISCLVSLIDVIIGAIGLAWSIYDSKKNTQLIEKLIEKEDERIEWEKAKYKLQKEGIELSKKQLEVFKDIKKLIGPLSAPGDSMVLSHTDRQEKAKMDYETIKRLEKTIENLIKLGARKYSKRKKK